MKVFVWIGYGIVDVYKFETVKDAKYLWELLQDSIKYFDDDSFNEELEKSNKHIEKYSNSGKDEIVKSYRAAINNVLDNGIMDSDLEAFENGTGFVDIKSAPWSPNDCQCEDSSGNPLNQCNECPR